MGVEEAVAAGGVAARFARVRWANHSVGRNCQWKCLTRVGQRHLCMRVWCYPESIGDEYMNHWNLRDVAAVLGYRLVSSRLSR
jgi:hypothetical protein